MATLILLALALTAWSIELAQKKLRRERADPVKLEPSIDGDIGTGGSQDNRGRRIFRSALAGSSLASLVLVVIAAAMLDSALFLGVHCPECDRRQLGDTYAWWRLFFSIQTVFVLGGGLLAAGATIVASRRRYSIIALAGCLGLLVLAPL